MNRTTELLLLAANVICLSVIMVLLAMIMRALGC